MVVIFKFNKNIGMKFFMVLAPRRSGDQTRMEVTNDDTLRHWKNFRKIRISALYLKRNDSPVFYRTRYRNGLIQAPSENETSSGGNSHNHSSEVTNLDRILRGFPFRLAWLA